MRVLRTDKIALGVYKRVPLQRDIPQPAIQTVRNCRRQAIEVKVLKIGVVRFNALLHGLLRSRSHLLDEWIVRVSDHVSGCEARMSDAVCYELEALEGYLMTSSAPT